MRNALKNKIMMERHDLTIKTIDLISILMLSIVLMMRYKTCFYKQRIE